MNIITRVVWIVVFCMPSIGLASTETLSCDELIERGRLLIQERPNRAPGDAGPNGLPSTPNARRYVADSERAFAFWEQARKRCWDSAAVETDKREAARLTALGYWIAGESFLVQREQEKGCEVFAKGIDAVGAIEDRSPHLDRLYRALGHCVVESDGARGVALMEKGLALAIEAYGARDARLVETMVHLAVALPYSLTPTGDLSQATGNEVSRVEQRVAELLRRAWEIVQDDPAATPETIHLAADLYCVWLEDHGESCNAVDELRNGLIANLGTEDEER